MESTTKANPLRGGDAKPGASPSRQPSRRKEMVSMPHRAASVPRRMSVILAIALLALGLTTTGANASSRYTITTKQLAPGLVWKSIVDSVGPNRINALIVTPSQALSLDTATATATMPGNARTSAMATAHKALAGINGDFGASDGRPTHPFMDDGDLRVSGDH